jgi:serine/threonine-protein kinase mTOR
MACEADLFGQVCGIQGGFKTSCELSLTVFRDNKESLLAVLEALVYDPLINWRLVRAESQGRCSVSCFHSVTECWLVTCIATTQVASSFGSTRDGPNRRTIPNETEMLDGMLMKTSATLL